MGSVINDNTLIGGNITGKPGGISDADLQKNYTITSPPGTFNPIYERKMGLFTNPDGSYPTNRPLTQTQGQPQQGRFKRPAGYENFLKQFMQKHAQRQQAARGGRMGYATGGLGTQNWNVAQAMQPRSNNTSNFFSPQQPGQIGIGYPIKPGMQQPIPRDYGYGSGPLQQYQPGIQPRDTLGTIGNPVRQGTQQPGMPLGQLPRGPINPYSIDPVRPGMQINPTPRPGMQQPIPKDFVGTPGYTFPSLQLNGGTQQPRPGMQQPISFGQLPNLPSELIDIRPGMLPKPIPQLPNLPSELIDIKPGPLPSPPVSKFGPQPLPVTQPRDRVPTRFNSMNRLNRADGGSMNVEPISFGQLLGGQAGATVGGQQDQQQNQQQSQQYSNPYSSIGASSGQNTQQQQPQQFDAFSSYANFGAPGYANGGMLDLKGHEMDYRAKGGFVPIGKKERADDVPARLSKNEFVFTADAVRNAGGGNINKGAEKMYRLMKQLEGKF